LLDLRNYTAKLQVDTGNPLEPFKELELPYYFKESLLAVLFTPELKLGSVEVMRQNMLAMKIEACEADSIELEDAEYERIKKAVNVHKGFRREDTPFVARIIGEPPEG